MPMDDFVKALKDAGVKAKKLKPVEVERLCNSQIEHTSDDMESLGSLLTESYAELGEIVIT